MNRFSPDLAAFRDAVLRAQGIASADKAPTLPPVLKYDNGWQVGTGSGLGPFATRAEALAVLAARPEFTASVARKLPDSAAYRDLSEFRWLDAATSEDFPSSVDGSQISDDMIGEMVRNVTAANTAIVVDGGNVSEVHESVWNSAAKAAGWVFGAAEVRDADGKPHLFLLVRLQRAVDASIEAQELLFGSIAFIGESRDRYGDGESIGAQLVSYALTNTPFVGGLEPHAPRARSANSSALEPIHFTRTHQIMTIKDTAASDVADDTIPAPEDAPAERMAPPVPGEELQLDADAEADPEEREADFEGAEAAEMFAADMLDKLRMLFDMPEATPGELVEKFNAASEGFASSLDGEPVDGPDAGPEGTPDGERAMERADAIGLRTQIKALAGQVATLTAERAEALAVVAAETMRRSMVDHIGERYAAARLATPEGEDLEEILGLCRSVGDKWKTLVERTLRGANQPPKGLVLPAADKTGRQPLTKDEAISFCEEAIRAEAKAEGKTIRRTTLRAQSYARAKKLHAEVFAGGSDSN